MSNQILESNFLPNKFFFSECYFRRHFGTNLSFVKKKNVSGQNFFFSFGGAFVVEREEGLQRRNFVVIMMEGKSLFSMFFFLFWKGKRMKKGITKQFSRINEEKLCLKRNDYREIKKRENKTEKRI